MGAECVRAYALKEYVLRPYVEQFSVRRGTVRALLRTSSMTHKKRVLLSLTSTGAVVQPLALEPMAADTSNV
jgi:hypothetical protein